METIQPSTPKSSLFKPFVSILMIAFFINLAAVNYVLYKNALVDKQKVSVVVSASPMATISANTLSSCDEKCVRKIVSEATASITLSLPPSTLKPIKTLVPSMSAMAQPTRELFVSFGKGQSSGIDWSDITGAEASINTAQFGSIKSIYFEVTLSIPSTEGIAYARLYNASDAKPVEGSDVSTTNSGATFLISQPIALAGTRVYKVQTKSTANRDVILSQSRIRVVLN